MTPADFMTEIVVPTVREFRDERRSRRRAYLACIAAFHVKDHLKKAGEKGIEEAMRVECGSAFDAVRGICNGTKHVQTDASHAVSFKAGEDWDRPPARLGEMVLGLSQLGDPHGGREIKHSQARLDLYQCAKAVTLAYQNLYPRHFATCDLSDC